MQFVRTIVLLVVVVGCAGSVCSRSTSLGICSLCHAFKLGLVCPHCRGSLIQGIFIVWICAQIRVDLATLVPCVSHAVMRVSFVSSGANHGSLPMAQGLSFLKRTGHQALNTQQSCAYIVCWCPLVLRIQQFNASSGI